MYKIRTYNHATTEATTNAFEAAKNRAKESTAKGGVCLVYDDETLVGVGENGNWHEIKYEHINQQLNK